MQIFAFFSCDYFKKLENWEKFSSIIHLTDTLVV
jgi:hypothetical protein